MSTDWYCYLILAIVIMAASSSKADYLNKNGNNIRTLTEEQVKKLMKNPKAMTSPEMTAEEKNAPYLPDHLRCGGCKLVAIAIDKALAAQQKKTPDKTLTETQMMDAFETACSSEAYKDVGLKNEGGVNELSGPGMENHGSAGIMLSDDSLGIRLVKMCNSYVEEFEEDVIYQRWSAQKRHAVEKLLCNNSNSGYRGFADPCVHKQSQKQKQGKEEL